MAPSAANAAKPKRKATSNPDFKRIKAKVGKKATVKGANVTDTSFRAASLYVRTQTVETSNTTTSGGKQQQATTNLLFLTSSRGRTLQELTCQLTHAAENVRLSAAKGLHDAVVSIDKNNNLNNHNRNVIQAHLSVLIPSIGQCLVDEESDAVRRLGINILDQVLRKLSLSSSSSSHANNSGSLSTTQALRPFSALLMAFMSSALNNSLNRDICQTGAMATRLVSRAAPSLVTPYAATSLLPAMVRLFDNAVFYRQTHANATSTSSGGGRSSSSSATTTTTSNGNGKRPSSKKRKTKKSSSSSSARNAWHFLLSCLLSVLQTLNADDQEKGGAAAAASFASQSFVSGEADWKFQTGGRSKNALLVVPGSQSQQSHALHPMRSLKDLSWALHQLYSSSSPSSNQRMNSGLDSKQLQSSPPLSSKTARQLLEKLRDVFVELTDDDNNDNDKNGGSIAANNLDTFLLLSKCLRLLCDEQQLSSSISAVSTKESSTEDNDDEAAKSRRVLMQLNGYILDIFPLVAPHNNSDSDSHGASIMTNEINGQLCLTLMSMSAILIQPNDAKAAGTWTWQGKVFDYIKSSIQDWNMTSEISDKNDSSSSAAAGTALSSSSSKHILDGFCRLACCDNTGIETDNKALASKRTKLIKAFAKSFFPTTEPSSTLNVEAARSYTGRQSVGLTYRIFSNYHFEMDRIQDALGKKDTTRMVHGLADYLIAWRGDFPAESETALRLLHALMIRVGESDNEECQDIRGYFGQRLETVLFPLDSSDCCIFELYPEHLQRLMIGFIVVTLGPSPTTKATFLTALARVCGRSNAFSTNTDSRKGEQSSTSSSVISADVASFVIHSMYSIRQRLPMADFLTFLLDGMGIIQADETSLTATSTMTNNGTNKQEDGENNDQFQSLARLVELDRGVKDASHCLVGCGSRKVLSMLHPLLSRWLEEEEEDPSAAAAAAASTTVPKEQQKRLLQSRAALALMAMFSLDMKANTSPSSSTSSIFDCLPESFETCVTKSIVRLLQYTPTETTTEQEYQIIQSWMSPIVSLITSEHGLLLRVFQVISDDLSTMEPAHQAMVVQGLLWLCKKKELVDMLQRSSQDLLQYTSSMEKVVAGGPLERVVGHIIGTVEVHSKKK